jgi:hypothetical protein
MRRRQQPNFDQRLELPPVPERQAPSRGHPILAAPRARLNEAITRILERAQDACAVRADVTAADIVALLAASFRAAESIDRPPRVLFEILRTGLERRA